MLGRNTEKDVLKTHTITKRPLRRNPRTKRVSKTIANPRELFAKFPLVSTRECKESDPDLITPERRTQHYLNFISKLFPIIQRRLNWESASLCLFQSALFLLGEVGTWPDRLN